LKRNSNVKERNLITQFDPKSPISEAFRTLRTNIQFSSVDKQIKTMMLTSTGPSEGKSTITSNLAIVMAQSGKRTLLVDADMRKPTIHRTFRIVNREGLTNILANQAHLASMEEAIVPSVIDEQNRLLKYISKTEIENLDVIPTGPIPPNPAELLGSKSMARFIKEVSGHYDVILFDTPPVIAVTDAQILASQLDGVLLVINSGKTNRDMAIKAKGLLDNVKANILGCVLNNREITGDNYYYYYYGADR
jgi:protein-tyrosine kinase